MQNDRRLFSRHDLVFPVQVRLEPLSDDQIFTTESTNISRKAIEVRCDAQIIDTLNAKKQYPHTGRLRFQLPDDQYQFDVAVQVVSHRRLSQYKFLLALIFIEKDNCWNRVLENHLDKLRYASADS